MRNTIFRKATFKCAGCGAVQEVKAQVPAEHAVALPATPEGWGTADVVGRHDGFGVVTVLAVPVCSEECGNAFLHAMQADAVEAAAGTTVPLDVLTWVKAAQKAFAAGAKSGGIDTAAQKAQPRLVAVPGDDGFDAPKAPAEK